MKPGYEVRKRAMMALLAVERRESGSQDAVDTALRGLTQLDVRDRGLATELVYGTLRAQRRLDRWIGPRCKNGLEGLDERALVALRIGAYQLFALDRVPDYAAIDATTEATRGIVPRQQRGFVHGVLRRLARERPWDADDVPVQADLPAWLRGRIGGLAARRGLDGDELAAAFCGPAPQHVHAIAAGGLDELAEQGIELRPLDGLPGIAEVIAGHVLSSPAFAARRVLVQDAASAVVARWLGVQPGMRVVDVCAGTGIKSLVLAAAGAEVTAVDVAASKLELAGALCEQAGHPLAAVVAGDMAKGLPLPPESFDAVLVDAPCTGLGTLRRRPEIRHRRRAADIHANTGLQRAILGNAMRLLKPGGVLVYAVCSFAVEEGADTVDRALAVNPDFARLPGGPDDLALLLDERGDLSTTPMVHGMDAFCAARLTRTV